MKMYKKLLYILNIYCVSTPIDICITYNIYDTLCGGFSIIYDNNLEKKTIVGLAAIYNLKNYFLIKCILSTEKFELSFLKEISCIFENYNFLKMNVGLNFNFIYNNKFCCFLVFSPEINYKKFTILTSFNTIKKIIEFPKEKKKEKTINLNYKIENDNLIFFKNNKKELSNNTFKFIKTLNKEKAFERYKDFLKTLQFLAEMKFKKAETMANFTKRRKKLIDYNKCINHASYLTDTYLNTHPAYKNFYDLINNIIKEEQKQLKTEYTLILKIVFQMLNIPMYYKYDDWKNSIIKINLNNFFDPRNKLGQIIYKINYNIVKEMCIDYVIYTHQGLDSLLYYLLIELF